MENVVSVPGAAVIANDLPPEEQQQEDVQHEEQHQDEGDVEMDHSPIEEEEQSTQIPLDEPRTQAASRSSRPITTTFRRDPNIARASARRKLLMEINQSHEAGQFYVDVVPPDKAVYNRALHQICEQEIEVDAFSSRSHYRIRGPATGLRDTP